MQLIQQLLVLRQREHQLVGRDTFAWEVLMVTLTIIGLLLSLAQVAISLRRK